MIFNSPEEMAEAVEQHAIRIRMEAQNFHHSVRSLFEELTKDQLIVLRQLLILCAGETSAAFFDGQISTYIRIRFGVCTACGVDHDAEFLEQEAVREAETTPIVQGEVVSPIDEEEVTRLRQLLAERKSETALILPTDFEVTFMPELEPKLKWDGKGPNPLDAILTDDDRANMKKYHLDDAWNVETHEFAGFACTGVTGTPCGLTYVSITDRMVKAPDDCHGCNNKSKWG